MTELPEAELAKQADCESVTGFYAPPSHELIGRLCRAFLNQNVITPTELLHHQEYQRRMAAAANVLQATIQKVAVAQARARGQSVTERIRQFHDMVDAIGPNLASAAKLAKRLKVTPSTFVSVVRQVVATATDVKRDTHVNHLLACYLFDAATWEAKLERLIALDSPDLAANERRYLDILVGKIVRNKVALDSLLGQYESLSQRLYEAVDLYLGAYVPKDAAAVRPVVAKLNAFLATSAWPATKLAVIANIHGMLDTWTPLSSSDFLTELRAISDVLANLRRMDAAQGATPLMHLVHKRVGRTLSPSQLSERVRQMPGRCEQIRLLLEIAQHVGEENRLLIVNYVEYILSDREFEKDLFADTTNTVEQLRQVAGLHRAIVESALDAGSRARFAEALERLQQAVLKRTEFFRAIDRQFARTVEKASRLVELCALGTFTDGSKAETARKLAVSYMMRPEFLPQFLDGAQGDERAVRIATLQKALMAAGIDRATAA